MPDTDTHLNAGKAYEDTEWLSVGEAAEVLGVSVQSLQRWDRSGKFVAHRSPTNRRRYLRSELNTAFAPPEAA